MSLPNLAGPGASAPASIASSARIPTIPSQGMPSRSGGLPGSSTSAVPSVISAVAGATAGSGLASEQPAVSVVTPTATVGGAPAPAASGFDPRSSGNVAVNFGLPGTEVKGTLLETCSDPNVDIVILGFLSEVAYGASIYPRLQLNPCMASTQSSQMKKLAPGLFYYPTIEADIIQCQTKYGKKIFLGIGGEGNTLPLASDEDAITFANHVWELFGPLGHIDPSLRPFGSAVLDGYDLNKQDECAANFDTFGATLRSHFSADTARDYFLSAAPGCSYPDISIHPGYLAQSDFVWPRFYNNSRCEIGSAGFLGAVKGWSAAVAENAIPSRDSTPGRTHLYIGLPARQDVVSILAGLLATAKEAIQQQQEEGGLGGVMIAVLGKGGDGLGLRGVLGAVKAALGALV
ncbi:glycoside hydrolase superfamily [Chaetomium fimeti]|uniref:Glycoside hydrolase superfamily n=1 Tax=Chaetomium fimeti TaxID=1854472 RepID=A0AAE0LXM6_9PEZI|nr:glycoside hydrolase superfamily [Chaetomium fimeti]